MYDTMFSSISSCLPSTVVTTSFTSTTTQTLRVNTPFSVEEPKTFYVRLLSTTYQFWLNYPGTLYATNVPDLDLIEGNQYTFFPLSLINQPLMITDTSGNEYTDDVEYIKKSDVFRYHISSAPLGTGVYIYYIPYGAGSNSTYIFPPNRGATNDDFTIWVQPLSGSFPYLLTPPEFSSGYVYSSPSTQFIINYPTLSGVEIRIVGGGLLQVPTTYPVYAYIVKANGVLLTYGVDYLIKNGFVGFYNVYPFGTIITVELAYGIDGSVWITPNAATPRTLEIRGRQLNSSILHARLNILSSPRVHSANTLVTIRPNDYVSCSVTSPPTYLGYNYYEYSIDEIKSYFAVVNKNNYSPFVKVLDRPKRYFNYLNYTSSYTIVDGSDGTIIYVSLPGLSFGKMTGTVNFNHYHIVLDIPNYKVNLYTVSGGLHYTIVMPDFPISYALMPYTLGSQTLVDLIVLCSDGALYRVKSNLQYTRTNRFVPTSRSEAFLDSVLPYNEDIPFQGTFTDYVRRNIAKSLFPVVVSFDIKENTTIAYLIGTTFLVKANLNNGAIYDVKNFPSLSGFTSVCYHDKDGVVVTTTDNRIFYIQDIGGVYNMTPSGGPFLFTMACSFGYKRAGRSLVADCHNRRLVVINGTNPVDTSFIYLGDFVPAYLKRVSYDTVIVTGHDTNEVIKIKITDDASYVLTENVATQIDRYNFSKKVTVASYVGTSLLGHHYLDNRTILDLEGSGIKKVIPYRLEYREGSLSSIGTTPIVMTMLGESTITPIPGPQISWWVNGSNMANVNDAQYLGVNYRSYEPGRHKSFIIVGEYAFDYETLSVLASFYTDHYKAGSYGSNFLSNLTATYIPPEDSEGDYTLPFSINYFGTLYNSFKYSANHGILSFDLTFPLAGITPSFAAANTDALLIEPRLFYRYKPVDNRIVAAVTYANLVGGKIPGVYYSYGLTGEFEFYKWKAIGVNTTGVPSPNGIVKTTVNIAQTGTVLNLSNTTSILVGDYVSNPVSSLVPVIVSTGPVVGSPTCQVLSINPYTYTVLAYKTDGKKIYLNSPAFAHPKYADITSSAGDPFGFASSVFTNTSYTANTIISIDYINNKVILEGLVNLNVIDKDKFIFEFTTTYTSTTYERGNVSPFFSNIKSISSSITVNPLVTATGIINTNFNFSPASSNYDNLIELDQTTYNRLIIGQTLTSNLFIGTKPIVNLVAISQVYNLIVTPALAWEGIPGRYPATTIQIDLITTNIPNGTNFSFDVTGGTAKILDPGADFEQTWTIEWPATALTPVTRSAGPQSIIMYSNHIRLKIPVRADSTPYSIEKLENYFVTVTDLSTLASISLGGTGKILNIGNTLSNTPVAATPVVRTKYYMDLGLTLNYTTTSTFSVIRSEISFASIPASVIISNTTYPISAGPDTIIPTYDDILQVDVYTTTLKFKTYVIETIANVITSLSGTLNSLDITGNFVTLDVAQNLPANTDILFKTYFVYDPVEFEVAFYKGSRYQYIEYNYLGAPGHNNTLTIGLRNAPGTVSMALAGTPSGTYSHLFGGLIGDGVINNIGPGEFDKFPIGGFSARAPRIYRTRSFDPNSATYSVYIDQKISALFPVRASLDYGYLYLNDGLYDGSKNISEGDILTVVVPFYSNRTVSSVILSLGKNQFAIPVAPDYDLVNKTITRTILPNYQLADNVNINFTISVTGRYMIPDYFRSSIGAAVEMIFELWNASTGTFVRNLANGSYQDLVAGDEIRVKNIFTGYRQYNQIEIVLAGPEIMILALETIGRPDILNFINFGLLDSPYIRYYQPSNLAITTTPVIFTDTQTLPIPQFQIGSIFTETFDNSSKSVSDQFYVTRSVPAVLQSTVVGSPVTLFSDTANVTFIHNNIRTKSQYHTINSGDAIGLEWAVQNYYADSVSIYQITNDPLDSSEVYTKVASWQITNRSITPLFLNGIANTGRSLGKIEIVSAGLGYDINTITIDFEAPPAGGTKPRAYAKLAAGTGSITDIVVTDAGSGYVNDPDVYIYGTAIVPAVVVASLTDDLIPHETILKKPFEYTKQIVNDGSYTRQLYTTYSNETFLKTPLIMINLTINLGRNNILNDYVSMKGSSLLFSSPLTYQFIMSESLIRKNSASNSNFSNQGSLILSPFAKGNIQNFIELQKSITIEDNIQTSTVFEIKEYDFEHQQSVNYISKNLNDNEFYKFYNLYKNSPDPFFPVPYLVFDKRLYEEKLPVQAEIVKKFDNYEKTYFDTQFIDGFPFENIKYREVSVKTFDYEFFLPPTELLKEPYDAFIMEMDFYYGYNSQGYDTISNYDVTAPVSEFLGPVQFSYDMPDEDLNIFTLFLIDLLASEYLDDNLRLILQAGYEFLDDGAVISPMPESKFVVNNPFLSEELQESLFKNAIGALVELTEDFYYFGPKIIPPFVPDLIEMEPSLIPPFIPDRLKISLLPLDLQASFVIPTNRYIDLSVDFVAPNYSRYFYFRPDFFIPTNRYIDLSADLLPPANRYLDLSVDLLPPANRYLDLTAQLVYQDKFFTTLIPEWIYQDKIFTNLIPEWIYQDKAFIDLIPEWLYQDKAFIQLPTSLADSGNRYLESFPYLWNGLNDQLFLNFPPQLEHVNLQYQDGYDLYGAIKSEFLIYADHGRDANTIQYQGTPPGTPGRTNLPILSYREFMGSALLKYSSTYGLGGYGTQSLAQIQAAKFVNATAIPVPLLNYWNYRVHFARQQFNKRTSKIFPIIWYIRGA